MRNIFALKHEGKILTHWEMSENFPVHWGDLIAAPVNGKLKGFRIVGMTATEILLMSTESENRPRCL